MNYAGTDKTNTFGANAVIHFVPEKWTLHLQRHAPEGGRPDGHHGAREAGSFYNPGRTTLIPAGQGGARTSTTGTTPS